MNKYIHGSEDSIDVDVYYVFDKMPSFKECQDFCSDKEENRNIITIQDGIVVDCYKGTPDEINNGLYYTYDLHQQIAPMPIKRLVERDVLIKSVRVVRCLLSHLSRTRHRETVKMALGSPDWQMKIFTLGIINLSEIDDFGKNGTKLDVLKVFAFQLGQILGLHEGVELYTKSAVAKRYPSLEDFLYRRPSDINILQQYVYKFLDIIGSYHIQVTDNITYFEDFDKRIDLKTETYL